LLDHLKRICLLVDSGCNDLNILGGICPVQILACQKIFFSCWKIFKKIQITGLEVFFVHY